MKTARPKRPGGKGSAPAERFAPGDLAFGYCRDSGGSDQELSVVQQQEGIREWCAANGVAICKWFIDAGKSGTTAKNRKLHRVVAELSQPDCPARGVIVWTSSRWARDQRDATYFRSAIRRAEKIYYSVQDSAPEGNIGFVVEALHDWANAQASEDNAVAITRGLHWGFRNHKALGGTPPKGFRKEKFTVGTHRDDKPRIMQRWVPDPDEAPKVRLAFEMRAAGASLDEIHRATRLYRNLNGYSPMFSKEIYLGIAQFGESRDEAYCEPIVPLGLWQRVQGVQARFRRSEHTRTSTYEHPRRRRSSGLLSGLAFCTLCGSPLSAHWSGSHPRNDGSLGPPTLSYVCNGRYNQRSCKAQRVPRALLDQMVIQKVRRYVLRPDVFERFRTMYLASLGNAGAEIEAKILPRKKERVEIQRKIGNVTEGIAELGISKDLSERLAALVSQRDEIDAELAELSAQLQPRKPLTDEAFRSLVSDFGRLFAKGDLAGQQLILRGIIHRIDVARVGDRVKGRVAFYYPDVLDSSSAASDSTAIAMMPPPKTARDALAQSVEIEAVVSPGKRGKTRRAET